MHAAAQSLGTDGLLSLLLGADEQDVAAKKQAQESIRDEALRCGMHYVNARWLGGMLTLSLIHIW